METLLRLTAGASAAQDKNLIELDAPGDDEWASGDFPRPVHH